MAENLIQIDPRQEDFTILKVHEVTEIGNLSICYGSVQFRGDPFFALYMIEPEGLVWLWDKRRDSEGSKTRNSVEKQMKIIATLQLKTDDLLMESAGAIPVKVATEGKAAITAYLFAVEGRNLKNIQDVLGVKNVDVVRKYIQRYLKKEVRGSN